MNYSNMIKFLNPADVPMIDTDYGKWLSAGGYANNRIQSKINYLRSKGFKRGLDKIDHECIERLNWISDNHFYQKVAR